MPIGMITNFEMFSDCSVVHFGITLYLVRSFTFCLRCGAHRGRELDARQEVLRSSRRYGWSEGQIGLSLGIFGVGGAFVIALVLPRTATLDLVFTGLGMVGYAAAWEGWMVSLVIVATAASPRFTCHRQAPSLFSCSGCNRRAGESSGMPRRTRKGSSPTDFARGLQTDQLS